MSGGESEGVEEMLGGKLDKGRDGEEMRRAEELVRRYYGDALRYAVEVMNDETKDAEDRKKAVEVLGKALREGMEPAGSGD